MSEFHIRSKSLDRNGNDLIKVKHKLVLRETEDFKILIAVETGFQLVQNRLTKVINELAVKDQSMALSAPITVITLSPSITKFAESAVRPRLSTTNVLFNVSKVAMRSVVECGWSVSHSPCAIR